MPLKLAFGTVSFVLFLTSFAFVSAQESPGTTSSIYCPNLTITMQKCLTGEGAPPLSQQKCTDATTGGQVTRLQRFLSDYYDLDPNTYITGYFGKSDTPAKGGGLRSGVVSKTIGHLPCLMVKEC